MATVTFGTDDPQEEARALVEALVTWLVEQPTKPARPAKAHFEYDANGLRSVTVTLDDEE